MEVIKRNGSLVPFQPEKIDCAISKAGYVKDSVRQKIVTEIANLNRDKISVEEIQDLVEKKLMATSYKDVAREYVRFRYKRQMIRETEKVNSSVLEIIDAKNEYINGENSNKNPTVNATQRDYMAGEVSKDLTFRLLLPDDIVKAHDSGILHFHDSDYFAQHMHNCCLVNLEDMLQNGTVINGIKIEPQHRLLTATTVATQIITAVASSQYGGTTISLTHLAPYVRKSYEIYIKKYKNRNLSEEQITQFAKEDLKKEISDAVQTFNYQINSMSTTNG